MILESKFDFDDKVWRITQRTRKEWVECAFCKGQGQIAGVDGTWAQCPKCQARRGKNTYHEERWQVLGGCPLTIGQIRVQVRNEYRGGIDTGPGGLRCENYGHQEAHREESYMMRETGIGSGSVYYAQDLFASPGEAQAECDKRNATEQENDNG